MADIDNNNETGKKNTTTVGDYPDPDDGDGSSDHQDHYGITAPVDGGEEEHNPRHESSPNLGQFGGMDGASSYEDFCNGGGNGPIRDINITWEQYKQHMRKNYTTKSEDERRMHLFLQEQTRVRELSAANGRTLCGLNDFSDWTELEKSNMCYAFADLIPPDGSGAEGRIEIGGSGPAT